MSRHAELHAHQNNDAARQISDAVRRKSPDTRAQTRHGISDVEIGYALRSQSWEPGHLKRADAARNKCEGWK